MRGYASHDTHVMSNQINVDESRIISLCLSLWHDGIWQAGHLSIKIEEVLKIVYLSRNITIVGTNKVWLFFYYYLLEWGLYR